METVETALVVAVLVLQELERLQPQEAAVEVQAVAALQVLAVLV
jgi:hypothetical protein